MNIMTSISRPLAALAILLSGLSVANAYPLHNFNNPRDVDNNGVVDSVDLSLVVDQIRLQQNEQFILPLQQTATIYPDTSNDAKLTPNDVLIVANYLLRATPEPATVVSAMFGLAAFAGFCWRKHRNRR